MVRISRQSSFANFNFKKSRYKVLVDDHVFEPSLTQCERGSDCWFSDDPQRFFGKKVQSDQNRHMWRVWFDSSSTHSLIAEKEQIYNGPCMVSLEAQIVSLRRSWLNLPYGEYL